MSQTTLDATLRTLRLERTVCLIQHVDFTATAIATYHNCDAKVIFSRHFSPIASDPLYAQIRISNDSFGFAPTGRQLKGSKVAFQFCLLRHKAEGRLDVVMNDSLPRSSALPLHSRARKAARSIASATSDAARNSCFTCAASIAILALRFRIVHSHHLSGSILNAPFRVDLSQEF